MPQSHQNQVYALDALMESDIIQTSAINNYLQYLKNVLGAVRFIFDHNWLIKKALVPTGCAKGKINGII